MPYLDEPLSFALYIQPNEKEKDVAFSMMLLPCVSKLNFTPFWSNFQRKNNYQDKAVWFWYGVCAWKSVSWLSTTFARRLCSVVDAVMHGVGFSVALKDFYSTGLNLQSSLGIVLIWSTLTNILPHFQGQPHPSDWSKRGCKIHVPSFHLKIIWKVHPNSRTLSGIG